MVHTRHTYSAVSDPEREFEVDLSQDKSQMDQRDVVQRRETVSTHPDGNPDRRHLVVQIQNWPCRSLSKFGSPRI